MAKKLLLPMLALFLYGCQIEIDSSSFNSDCIKGNGNVVTKTLELVDFSKIGTNTSVDITISEGSTQSVTATGDSNIIDILNTNVDGDSWNIKFTERCANNFKLKIDITSPDLSEISSNGSGDIDIQSINSSSGSLSLTINGSGDIKSFDSANMDLMDIKIRGSGNVHTYSISAEKVNAKIQGSGDIKLTANDQLDAGIYGSGNISYKGSASVSSSVHGSGRVIDAN